MHCLQLCAAHEMKCFSNTVLVAADIKQHISFPMHSSAQFHTQQRIRWT